MNKELKSLINETLDEFFENAPSRMIEIGIREERYDVCPHCKKEIYERHEYTEDGGKTWRHSECKGLITRPPTGDSIIGESEAVPGMPPSGEEKYSKQEPGGIMGTSNTATIANETTVENKEVQILSPTRDSKFFDGETRFINRTKMRLKVICHRFQARVGEVYQSAYAFVVEEEP